MYRAVKNKTIKLLFILTVVMQKILLVCSYWLFHVGKKNRWCWVVGVDEIANCTRFISESLDQSYSVVFVPCQLYSTNTYNFSLPKMKSTFARIARIFAGPVLLGYLCNRAPGFFYVGSSSFLLNRLDARDYEFAFLKRKGKKIANFFCGSEIRSLVLSIEHANTCKLEISSHYYKIAHPDLQLDFHEKFIEQLAASSDKYADIIFNAPVDQISYLKRKVHPYFYAYPDDSFVKNSEKFDRAGPPIIVHAPTSIILKGTQLIRAAIKKLQFEGYKFEYVELMGVTNEVVLSTLNNAHIVINELYAHAPGVLGIEAMASNCALLTSADRTIEKIWPEGANEAWFVTRCWDIYDNLKTLLDNPDLVKQYADRGFEWTYKNYRASVVRENLREVLKLETGIV